MKHLTLALSLLLAAQTFASDNGEDQDNSLVLKGLGATTTATIGSGIGVYTFKKAEDFKKEAEDIERKGRRLILEKSSDTHIALTKEQVENFQNQIENGKDYKIFYADNPKAMREGALEQLEKRIADQEELIEDTNKQIKLWKMPPEQWYKATANDEYFRLQGYFPEDLPEVERLLEPRKKILTMLRNEHKNLLLTDPADFKPAKYGREFIADENGANRAKAFIKRHANDGGVFFHKFEELDDSLRSKAKNMRIGGALAAVLGLTPGALLTFLELNDSGVEHIVDGHRDEDERASSMFEAQDKQNEESVKSDNK